MFNDLKNQELVFGKLLTFIQENGGHKTIVIQIFLEPRT